jgi:hypothetical protein
MDEPVKYVEARDAFGRIPILDIGIKNNYNQFKNFHI